MPRSSERLVVFLAALLMAPAGSVGDEPPARRVPGWGEVVDPSGDCKIAHDPARDRLRIAVPGTPHVLSAEVAGLPLDAPRVVRDVGEDFRATVKVAGRLEPGATRSTSYDPYHGAGLLVWKDGRNYLRLERAVGIIHGRATPYLNYELREDGRLSSSRGVPIPDRPLRLKLERSGGEIRAWWGDDGSKWTPLPGPSIPMAGRVRVGVVAINSSRHPLNAELEGLRVDTTAGPPATAARPAGPTPKPAVAAVDRPEAK